MMSYQKAKTSVRRGQRLWISPAIIAVLGLSVAVPSLCVGDASEKPAADRPAVVYELTINGETFEVPEGTEVRLVSRRDKDLTYSVRLVKKRIQRYETENIAFDYDVDLSLDDDQDFMERTITLMHAAGYALVITEQESVKPRHAKSMLQRLIETAEQSIKRGNIRELKHTAIRPAAFKHAEGFASTISFIDEDGDEQIWEVYVVVSEGKVLSLFHQYLVEDKERAVAGTKPTFDSIRYK